MTPQHDALNAQRFGTAVPATAKVAQINTIADRIQRNWSRYETVSRQTSVPAHVIAGLHNMESGGSFRHHLHEGSSLSARTRYVPIGRPKTGNPPFTWEYSAQDALNYDRMGQKNWKDIGAALSACEGYNGWGYYKYHKETPTPYLWAASSVERPGKYVADGKWSSTARSQQIGIAVIWKELARRGLTKAVKAAPVIQQEPVSAPVKVPDRPGWLLEFIERLKR